MQSLQKKCSENKKDAAKKGIHLKCSEERWLGDAGDESLGKDENMWEGKTTFW